MGSSFILPSFLVFIFFFIFLDCSFVAARNSWSSIEMVEMNGYGEHKLSSVVITGSLLCNTPVSGATVAIKCHTGYKKRSNWIKVITDEYGEFVIHLPSHLHAIPHLEKACFIKPIHVPRHYHRCHKALTKSNIHKSIKFVSSRNGFRVYTSGTIRLLGHGPRSYPAHKSDI